MWAKRNAGIRYGQNTKPTSSLITMWIIGTLCPWLILMIGWGIYITIEDHTMLFDVGSGGP